MKHIFFVLFILSGLASCRKYLDGKSNQKLSTPSTLTDLQSILDNASVNRGCGTVNTGSDEYYLDKNIWEGLYDPSSKDGYVWGAATQNTWDWNDIYYRVFTANTVLDHISSVDPEDKPETLNAIKATALYLRAFYFWNLAQVYCPVYNASSAASEPGIVLRLNADFNEPSVRSSVERTYDQITSDLLIAADLLPPFTVYKTRPDKASAHALLARVYLSMGDYAAAAEQASQCLQARSALMDYNQLTASDPLPFALFNEEVLFHSSSLFAETTINIQMNIDSTLYDAYTEYDLRKLLFFSDQGNGSHTFRGSYDADNYGAFFDGLAVDEVYLTRAECYARLGKLPEALSDLNMLLANRMDEDHFDPVTSSDAGEVLERILLERKKELVFRGTRWTDIRRLNRDGAGIELRRIIDQQVYSLPPNDLRYTWLIPDEVINITGMPQNKR